jgi:hypothetical protein
MLGLMKPLETVEYDDWIHNRLYDLCSTSRGNDLHITCADKCAQALINAAIALEHERMAGMNATNPLAAPPSPRELLRRLDEIEIALQ